MTPNPPHGKVGLIPIVGGVVAGLVAVVAVVVVLVLIVCCVRR